SLQLADGEAAGVLLRLDERAVNDDSLVATRPDRGRRPCRLELRAAVDDLRAIRLEPLKDVRVHLLLLRCGCGLVVDAVVEEEECVLAHGFGLSCLTFLVVRRTASPSIVCSRLSP